jgi:hypothetical protein
MIKRERRTCLIIKVTLIKRIRIGIEDLIRKSWLWKKNDVIVRVILKIDKYS